MCIDFTKRLGLHKKYVDFLLNVHRNVIILKNDTLNSYLRDIDTRPLEEKLALIYPGLHKHQTWYDQNTIQGNQKINAKIENQCESYFIFGYNCFWQSLNPDGYEPQNDHLFPYSLGGSSDDNGGNRITLCSYHNIGKSNSIHLYPWESIKPDKLIWLDNMLSYYKKMYN